MSGWMSWFVNFNHNGSIAEIAGGKWTLMNTDKMFNEIEFSFSFRG